MSSNERAKEGFNTKLDTGWFYGNRLRSVPLKIKNEPIADLLGRLKLNLRALSSEEPAALINIEEAFQRAKEETRTAALAAYPNCLEERTLRDKEGEYCWPGDLFDECFQVADVVVSFEAPGKQTGRIRLWSKDYVAQQSRNDDYIAHKRCGA